MPGYLFLHSGVLTNGQIEKCLKDAAYSLSENFEIDFKDLKMEINVVSNREGKKFGHSYAWVNNDIFYNALIGRNFDGSLRFEEIEDEDWEPPSKPYDEAIEEAEGSWAGIADVEDLYRRPMKRVNLEPLVTLPGIKYSEEQKEEIKEVDDECEIAFIEIFETKISEKIGKLNTIFSDNIPEWITEKMLLDRFKKFNKDNTVYVEKKSKNRFSYPIVKIKTRKHLRETKRFCTITFSPMFKNTASFLIYLVKRVEFQEGDKRALLFFSQSKSKN